MENTFNHIERARTYADYNRDRTVRRQVVKLQSSILERHHCRCVGELGVARHPFRFQIGFNVVERIKICHLAGDPALEIARIKKRNWTNPALGGKN